MPTAPFILNFNLGGTSASGTAEAGSTVTLVLDDISSGDPDLQLGQVVAAGDGSWSIDFAPLTGTSNYVIFAIATDAGGDSPNSEILRLNKPMTAPLLVGTRQPNELIGSDLNDTIQSGGVASNSPPVTGRDTLIGGLGDDTYREELGLGVNSGEFALIVELPGEGTDHVITEKDFALPDNVENLTGDRGSRILTGNNLDNVIAVNRTSGNSTVTGGGGNDTLAPSGLLEEQSGRPNSVGNIAVYSGDRSDYAITQLVNGFTIEDTRPGSPDGTDTVLLFDIFRFADGDLGKADLIGDIGQPPVPIIDGFDGDSREITGTAEAGSTLQLYSTSTLLGAPIVVPGDGRWTIVLPTLEHNSGSFTTTHDVVAAATNANGMSAGSERLTFVVSTGNEIEEVEGSDAAIDHTIIGPLDELRGGGGNDTLTVTDNSFSQLSGGSGNDLLTGDNGSNDLDGGTGDDTMIGGPGSDEYVVDSLGDVIIEMPNEGFDDVNVSLDTYVLPENFEDLFGRGDGQELTGNAANNFINGSFGSDILRGLDGNDRLS